MSQNKKIYTVDDIGELYKLASKGALPDGFDQYDLADNNGWTVGHSLGLHGHLPDDFNHYDLADHNGLTVAQVAEAYGHLPASYRDPGLSSTNTIMSNSPG